MLSATSVARHVHSLAPRLLRPAREIALAAILYLIYRAGRLAVSGQERLAFDHAVLVHRFEHSLHLPSESAIQGLIGSERLFRLANLYYVFAHFPALLLFLGIGLFVRPRVEYGWARNLLVVQTGLALVIHMLFPLAPPRMFPQWGFLDTMTVIGPSAYQGTGASVANQFAAMPSLHVGWTVLFAVVIVRTGPRWAAALAIAHSLITTVVVVVTANHWLVDAAASVVLLGVGLALFPAPGRPAAPVAWVIERLHLPASGPTTTQKSRRAM